MGRTNESSGLSIWTLVGFLASWIGAGILGVNYLSLSSGVDFLEFLKAHWVYIVGFLFLFVGGLLIAQRGIYTLGGSRAFVDVDARSRQETTPDVQDVPDDSEKSFSSSGDEKNRNRVERVHSSHAFSNDLGEFSSYFNFVISVLEQKAANADEKASILLDKGVRYSIFGISFYIFSIVAWQALGHFSQFKEQHKFGIASCSLLFIFIEFLSAWFLKQYRQFVDTSTYLIKVKSIFDKYMLVYLAGKEALDKRCDSTNSYTRLIEVLSREMQWPESYLAKNPDVGFAKEALEAMSMLISTLREQASRKSKKSDEGSGGTGI